MPSLVIDTTAGVTLYLKTASGGLPATSIPWSTGLLTGSFDSGTNRWTFSTTSAQAYLVYQQVGGSPASTDIEVGYVDGVDLPASAAMPGGCMVRFLVLDPTGVAVEGARVNVWLDDANSYTDTALVSRAKQTGVTNSDGYVDILMIQRESFARGGVYCVQVFDRNGRCLHERRVMVPLLDSCFASDLLDVL